MLQIIMLICGIGVAARMPKLLRRTAADCPGVDPAKFETWRRAEIRSAIAFLIASWGVLFLQLVLGFALGLIAVAQGAGPSAIQGWTQIATIGGFVLFLIALVPAAILGSRAARLKKEAGIP